MAYKSGVITRNNIISVSKKSFKQEGYNSTTIRGITKECDISIGAVYHHFANKLEIVTAILEEYFLNMMESSSKIEYENPLEMVLMLVHSNFYNITKDDITLEFYLEAVKNGIVRKLLKSHVKDNFHKIRDYYNLDLSNQDIDLAFLICLAAQFELLTEYKNKDLLMSKEQLFLYNLKVYPRLFNIPDEENNIIIDKVLASSKYLVDIL